MKLRWLFAICLACLSECEGGDALKLVGTVSLPGVSGRFDHFAVDPAGKKLFVAALGNNTLEVIGVGEPKRIVSIAGLRKPTGVVFLPAQNQIGVACGGDGVFKVFAGDNYKQVSLVDSLDDADNVRLDPQTGSIYVGYGDGALAIIDPKAWKKIGDIKIAGHPESFQLEPTGHRIFINAPGVKEISIADREKGRTIGSLPMTKFQSNFPMALDEPNHRLFIGCRRPARLLVYDTEKGAEIANTEISGDTDDLFYDPKRSRVYVSCGDGFIDIIQSPPSGPLNGVGKIPTRSGARTSFFSPDLDRLYLAVPSRGGDPAEIRIYEPGQP